MESSKRFYPKEVYEVLASLVDDPNVILSMNVKPGDYLVLEGQNIMLFDEDGSSISWMEGDGGERTLLAANDLEREAKAVYFLNRVPTNEELASIARAACPPRGDVGFSVKNGRVLFRKREPVN